MLAVDLGIYLIIYYSAYIFITLFIIYVTKGT